MRNETSVTSKRKPSGRVSSPKLRQSIDLARQGRGLVYQADRYHLLKLVERVGKRAGFTPRMVDLLAYYLRFTRDSDWEEGSRPIVFQSLSRTALDFGVSERQIQKLEKALFEAGALTWQDSGNHRRYGQRCPKDGKLLYAYGVDLTPLADLEKRLASLLEEKEAHARQWMETKRQISFYRRQVKAILAEAQEVVSPGRKQIEKLDEEYCKIAIQIRTHLGLPRLMELLDSHRRLYQLAKDFLEEKLTCQNVEKTEEQSLESEEKFAHNKNTNQFPSNKLDTGRASPDCLARGKRGEIRDSKEVPSQRIAQQSQRRVGEFKKSSPNLNQPNGSERRDITFNQVIKASSSRFQEYLPLHFRSLNEHHLVDAADRMRQTLQISKGSWSRACEVMGRVGAAICVLLTDQAALRDKDPVRVPGAYFNAMINRSLSGELNLKASLFALTKMPQAA